MALRYDLTRRAALAGAAAAVGALTLTACSLSSQASSSSDARYVMDGSGLSTAAKGDRMSAPNIYGETIEGRKLDVNSTYKGKIVVLNIWGSWCGPCRAEAVNLVSVAKQLKPRGVEFVGINTRDPSKGPPRAFEKDFGVEYPSLYDPIGKLLLRFPKGTLNPKLVPSTIVIDREGNIAASWLSAVSVDGLHKMLDPLVAEK